MILLNKNNHIIFNNIVYKLKFIINSSISVILMLSIMHKPNHIKTVTKSYKNLNSSYYHLKILNLIKNIIQTIINIKNHNNHLIVMFGKIL